MHAQGLVVHLPEAEPDAQVVDEGPDLAADRDGLAARIVLVELSRS
ncbi:hypothetical protein [Actinomadura sp. B10D3]